MVMNVNPSAMSYKDFREYLKSYKSLFESETDVLLRYERSGEVLSSSFCVSYIRLLEDRMRVCDVCSEYYRAMAERSFWFMKPRVLRRALKYEAIHNETLGRLLLVKLYFMSVHDVKEEERK